jgi:hypothetical protein
MIRGKRKLGRMKKRMGIDRIQLQVCMKMIKNINNNKMYQTTTENNDKNEKLYKEQWRKNTN